MSRKVLLEDGLMTWLAELLFRVNDRECTLYCDSQSVFFLGWCYSMTLVIAKEPELLDLTHYEACDAVQPLVLFLVPFILLGGITHRHGLDECFVCY